MTGHKKIEKLLVKCAAGELSEKDEARLKAHLTECER